MTNCFCTHSSVILVFIYKQNKHQNNPLVSAETVRHLSRYIILYIELNQTLCTSIYHTCNLDSCCHAWKGHIYLIYDKCRFYMINIKCQFGSNTSDWCAILIAHQIVMAKHGRSCVHFSGISTCGRTSRETVSHPQCPPLPTQAVQNIFTHLSHCDK